MGKNELNAEDRLENELSSLHNNSQNIETKVNDLNTMIIDVFGKAWDWQNDYYQHKGEIADKKTKNELNNQATDLIRLFEKIRTTLGIMEYYSIRTRNIFDRRDDFFINDTGLLEDWDTSDSAQASLKKFFERNTH